MSNAIKTIIDPGGFLTGKPNMQGAIDPGGAIIKGATGSDIGHRISDPAGIFTPETLPDIPAVPGVPAGTSTAEINQAADAAARAEQEAQRKRKGRTSTILTGGLGLETEAPTRKPTILGTVR